MHYEEEIIGGVLHYKSRPNGYWVEKSNIALTNEIMQLREELNCLKQRVGRSEA